MGKCPTSHSCLILYKGNLVLIQLTNLGRTGILFPPFCENHVLCIPVSAILPLRRQGQKTLNTLSKRKGLWHPFLSLKNETLSAWGSSSRLIFQQVCLFPAVWQEAISGAGRANGRFSFIKSHTRTDLTWSDIRFVLERNCGRGLEMQPAGN